MLSGADKGTGLEKQEDVESYAAKALVSRETLSNVLKDCSSFSKRISRISKLVASKQECLPGGRVQSGVADDL